MLKKVLSLATIIVAAGFVLYSCSKKNGGEGKNYSLTVTPSSTDSVSAVGGFINFTIDANGDWKVDSDQDWLVADPLRGDQDVHSFKAVFATNPSVNAARSAKLTVVMEDNRNVKQEFIIIQKPLDLNFTIHKTGKFKDDCVKIDLCFDSYPSLYHELPPITKSGTLTVSMPNSHFHVFGYEDQEPGYYENYGDMYFAPNPTVVRDSKNADCTTSWFFDKAVKLNREEPIEHVMRLKAGSRYWIVNTLELQCGDCDFFDAMTETYEITISFKVDNN